MQEVCTHRAVTVLETSQDNPVFHLRHLRAGVDHQAVSGPGRPWCVPDTARAFTRRLGLEDVGRATGATNHRLRLEDVEVAGADIEADGAGDPVFLGFIHQKVSDADAVEHLVGGLLSGLGDDGLVALTVDHDLPTAFAKIGAFFLIPHDREAPFLELVNRRIYVARHVE